MNGAPGSSTKSLQARERHGGEGPGRGGREMVESEIRVLIIEDHTIVREGLRLILAAAPGIAVVGDAPDGAAGLALLDRLLAADCVDVVLTDLVLPGLDGVEV